MMKKNEVKINKFSINKRFANKQGLVKEVVGANINGLLFGNCPNIISFKDETCQIKKLQDAITADIALKKGLLSNPIINKFITESIEKSIIVFSNLNQEFLQESWSAYLTNLIRKAESIKRLQKTVSKIKSLKIEDNIILIHGDLHLGNIMCNVRSKELTLIDFEHSKFAPVNLELANSLFWNDTKSLDLTMLSRSCNTVNLNKVKNLLPIYFAEQIIIATELKDQVKVESLFAKMKSINL